MFGAIAAKKFSTIAIRTFMLLQDKETGNSVEVMDIQSLINPVQHEITVRVQDGQEEQDPESLKKQNLSFPSGEDLPQCWLDKNYRIA
jgi:hypothetical protein